MSPSREDDSLPAREGRPARTVYTVSELSRELRVLIERSFPDVWVEGEVSNLRRSGAGHLYFTLKDDHAQIPAVCFRSQARYLRFRPSAGEAFRVRGRVGTYEARGEYQILVEVLEPAGRGALQAAFERLRGELGAEGLFDPTHKKPLPAFPFRIGVVTSPGSAALRDILSVLERRHSGVLVQVYPTEVQGPRAAVQLKKGIEYFGRGGVDVVILARGGGSVEDLWPFNDEGLVRAVFASPTPVISAVGHETDVVLSDFVADVRAPTPSAAAEIVIKTTMEITGRLENCAATLVRAMQYRVMELGGRLGARTGGRGFLVAEQRVRQMAQRVDDCTFRLGHSARTGALLGERPRRLERSARALDSGIGRIRVAGDQRLRASAGRLDALSPLAVLERGYAVCTRPDGTVLRRAADASVDEALEVRLREGRLDVVVRNVRSPNGTTSDEESDARQS
jgi:exodeoxyribonuclease VII large subunit